MEMIDKESEAIAQLLSSTRKIQEDINAINESIKEEISEMLEKELDMCLVDYQLLNAHLIVFLAEKIGVDLEKDIEEV